MICDPTFTRVKLCILSSVWSFYFPLFLFPSASFNTIYSVLFQTEGIKPDDFTWDAFQKFLDNLCIRPEIQSIFEERFVTLSQLWFVIENLNFHPKSFRYDALVIFLGFLIMLTTCTSCVTTHTLFLFRSSGSKRKPFISLDQLMDFINQRQRDSRLNEVLYPPLKREQVRQIMEKYETNVSQLERGKWLWVCVCVCFLFFCSHSRHLDAA